MKHYKVVVEMKPIVFEAVAEDEVEAFEEVVKEIQGGTEWTKKIEAESATAEEIEDLWDPLFIRKVW